MINATYLSPCSQIEEAAKQANAHEFITTFEVPTCMYLYTSL